VSDSRPAAVVVLAAGEGTRMRSALPKVLHPLIGEPLLGHVLAAASPAAPAQVLVVVGHGREAVVGWLEVHHPQATVVVQDQQLGTGHALRTALAADPSLLGTVVVVSGDTPLLSSATVAALVAAHAASGSAATVLTAHLPDPSGYGRVVRTDDGHLAQIVEDRDATDDQRRIDEVNGGIYAFDAASLRATLEQLTRDNSQGEEYLPDVVAMMRADGLGVAALTVADYHEVVGVNDRVQLAEAGRLLRDRTNAGWMRDGVTFVDPDTTWVGPDVTLGRDVVLHPGVRLLGRTEVSEGAEIGPDTTLVDTTVGPQASVRSSTCTGAVIGARSCVGPYTYLRPGVRLGPDTKAGAFVEAKNADIGAGSKVPHLSYVGDVQIGEGSNIGAATVVVNYDGVAKHRTVIGDHVRIGSDTMLIAPVEVGDGAYTAAGSVITDDVPPGAMGVGRARQRTIAGWVARRRAGTASAEAAARVGRTTSAPSDDNEAHVTGISDASPEATEGHHR
jgi:bifunctional UDP-N-acetylglucosamine pyrophosphorylase/glucosamine-1-phosphate N-acetyltransferase